MSVRKTSLVAPGRMLINYEMNKLEPVVDNDGKICYCCDSTVKGYHIYQDIWETNYGKLLSCIWGKEEMISICPLVC